MQSRYHFVAFCLGALHVLVSASDGYYYETPSVHAPLLLRANYPASVVSQYHTQDEFGQYAYGYAEPLSAKQEVRTLDGITRGSYTYLDAAGKLQTVAYTADAGGFRVAATNLPKQQQQQQLGSDVELDPTALNVLPQPVQETAEVAAARAAHLAAHQQAKLRLYTAALALAPSSAATQQVATAAATKSALQQYNDALPLPVQDTPEVTAAKVEFFKRYEEVKQRNERLQQQQQQQLQQQQQAHAQRFSSGLAALVKSQPITVTLPLPPSYQTTFIPTGAGYHYNVAVPAATVAATRAASRTYLPLV